MTYNDMLNLVLALPFDTMKEVYSNGKQSLLIYRPSTLSKRFKNYDINTNFQIFLKIGDDKPSNQIIFDYLLILNFELEKFLNQG